MLGTRKLGAWQYAGRWTMTDRAGSNHARRIGASPAVRVPLLSALVALGTVMLAGCQSGRDAGLPRGTAAYATIPAPAASTSPVDYRIGPLDVLSINVFREPDLTFKEVQIDAGGNLLFPLIGSVQAVGKTANELSRELADRLNERYLRNPQVAVVVVSSVSQRVTVEGNVTEPGVYEIGGRSTLLEALARAKSPTRVAALDQVVVFRKIDGQRMGAVFNVADIRRGRSPDPEILGGDVVVVGFSAVKGAFRDFLSSAPLLNIFRTF